MSEARPTNQPKRKDADLAISPLLEVHGLRTAILKPVSFQLGMGECIAVKGPSGAGKTLLLRAIADLDVSEGVVRLAGRDRAAIPGPEWRHLVGYVAAEPGWWAETVGEHFRTWAEAAPLCAQLGFSEEVKTWPVARLSTGERLRLALVRALLLLPRVLLLDEPTAALDEASVAAVETLIAARRKRGSRRHLGHARCRASQAHRAPLACYRRWVRAGEGGAMASYIVLSYGDLALASVLVLINAGLSLLFGLRIHRSLLIAAIRMVVQRLWWAWC